MAPRKKNAPKSEAPAVNTAAANVPNPRLHKLRVCNFRGIGSAPVEIELADIVVLVGPNNTGKSSILRAYEVIMSSAPLMIDDFPNSKNDPSNPPTIELETVVFDKTAPGERWVRTDPTTQEMFVREKWTWAEPGNPKKVGWDVTANGWHATEGPWGAPNVAQAYRPKSHYITAFQSPQEQVSEITNILKEAIKERVKEASKKRIDGNAVSTPSDYEKLLESIKKLQTSIASDAITAVEQVRTDLGKMIAEVFPGYCVTFDARPEDDLEKTLSLFKAAPLLKMGPQDGHQTTIERQGSGTCRTLLWTALRVLADLQVKEGVAKNTRPHLLLIDEPEICLHPNAIREACRVLYDLPKAKNWQVMITTHSPVFIDLSRDNTSIARVERMPNGTLHGTTIFRPSRVQLDADDRIELKLLNLCDPHVAEFFFAGRTILVEGDTEYTAFKHVIAQTPERYKDIHVVRARGKSCLVSLCKILNQFDKGYSILHDSDREKIVGKKTKKERANPAWTENQRILAATEDGRNSGKVRLLASVPNFEEAFFGEVADGDKPYSALARIKQETDAYTRIDELLTSLVDFSKPVPKGALQWTTLENLKAAAVAFDLE